MLALTLLVLVGSLAFVVTPAAVGQITAAAIHGTVTDPSGAVLPDATVTALNTSTGISTETTSNKSGYFLFPELQVGGPYSVTVSASGFENFVATGLTLNVNDNREVLATMKVGGTAATVQVTATALQVETSNTQLQQIITSDQLESIPMEGRDAAGLQKFEAGSVESSDRFGTYSSNGSQTPQNDVVLDGADNNDGPLQDEGIIVNPDALQEENIVTSTMNPEFSRNSGAVVNEVIKSGTNSIHGEGFEYYRDTFMNNANYFSPVDPTTGLKIRPIFHQNLYGGTLGGPIFKNKLFLFVAYQGDRNTTSTTAATSTFSGTKGSGATGNFAGDFSDDPNWADGFASNSAGLTGNPIPFAIGSCPKGTAWNVCFPGTTVVIPPSEWNSIASNLINKYVLASNSSSGLYEFNSGNTGAADQAVLRADYTPSSRDAIWASSIIQSSPSTNDLSFGGGTFPGFGQHAAEHFKLFNASYTHTFSANKLNELHGNYYRFNFPSVIPTPVQDPSLLGFQIHPQLALSGIPFMAVGNDFDLGNSYEGPQPRLDTNLTYADNFTWIRGNHSLKFGAVYE
ncbi:MAG: carboxypeptidase-like regulatory domain-containing protein, partial [Terracidiphilus sp.]